MTIWRRKIEIPQSDNIACWIWKEKNKLMEYSDRHQITQRSVAAKFNYSSATTCNILK